MTDHRPPGTPPVNEMATAFYGLGVGVIIFFIFWVAKGVILPFIMAILLSFLIVSTKNFIERLPAIGRLLPDTASFILAFAVIAIILLIMALIIRENVQAVISKAPEYQTRLTVILTNFVTWAGKVPYLPSDAVGMIEEIIDGFRNGIVPSSVSDPTPGTTGDTLRRSAFRAAQSIVRTATGTASNLLGSIVTVFLYTAFLLVERGRFSRKLTALAGAPSRRHELDAVISDISRLVRTYIATKSVINLSVATISFVIMSIIGIDFAGFWALLIFVFGFIPIIGAVIAVMAPTLLALIQPDGSLSKAVLTLIMLTGTEQMISSFVEPRVMGRNLNLSPLVILISLAVWGSIWGLVGMLLSVPLTVVALIVSSQFQATRPLAILLSDNGEVAPIRTDR
ncbi:hypothetical protein PB2503_06272 [Parvularcula bermudensis HTCC2503]|uniref:AI-2E family transporter n=1 Tax=Parvularcula bermudensis (strain ATCC BAA-594 / HTCC2503 / KCTC 12087) TaxID=314260 RepID=E0THM4_PARBH|nr:AI-2E family transporter [Parvularcula bermudensis]ADM09320.1 hypothetical protein PB2503_06272 [Parvularcula bermudensis HTCC2503]